MHVFFKLVDAPDVIAQLTSSDSNVVSYGLTVELGCTAQAGSLPITFTWQSPGGSPVSATSSNSTESNIFVTPTTSSDYGTYICTASNGGGSDMATIDLLEPKGKDNIDK